MQGFGDNFIPIVAVEGELDHTKENPFCFDSTCPCHEDHILISDVWQQVQDGLFTPKEATEFVNGRTM